MTKLVRYSPLLRRNPFGADLDRLFGELFTEDNGDSPTVWRPRVDISETESAFIVTADLPGVDKDDVIINFEDDTLVISGERKQEATKEETNYYRAERIYGRFSRSFTFPKGIEVDKIGATFKNGVLEVSVPKTAESKPRKITIK
jgi:HSP20 family protein